MLVADGFDVVGLDSFLFAHCGFRHRGRDEAPARFPEVRQDVRDLAVEGLRGFDAVVHLAGLSNDPLGDLQPETTFAINEWATVRLARLAKAAGVRRFIFSSTCSVYGAAGDDLVDETGATHPVTPYAHAKLNAEAAIAALADADFCPVFLRHATAYGPSPKIRFDLVVNNLVAWAWSTGHVLLKSDGTPWRPLVHVEDISRAFLAVLKAPEATVANQAYNVGRTDENHRVREIASVVVDVAPACAVTFDDNAGPDKRNYRVSFDKFSVTFGPDVLRWRLDDGVRQLSNTLAGRCPGPEEFEGPRFARLAHLKHLLSIGAVDDSFRWVSRPEPAEAATAGSTLR